VETQWARVQPLAHPARAAYLIWRKPWMAVGPGTYIGSLLKKVGLKNVFEEHASRYPAIHAEELRQAAPEVVLLSSEPYPFSEKHIAEIQELLPDAKILLVDGEPWSWYGSRMRHFPAAALALADRL